MHLCSGFQVHTVICGEQPVTLVMLKEMIDECLLLELLQLQQSRVSFGTDVKRKES